MRCKSFVRSLATFTFALLLLMAALARPVLAQSTEADDEASIPDAKATLQLSGPLDFGNVTINTTSTSQTETATDPSKKKIKVLNVSVSDGFTITSDMCTGAKLKNSACDVQVACMPTALGPITGGQITFTFKSGKKRHVSENLMCTGVTGATSTPTGTATPTPTATPTTASTATSSRRFPTSMRTACGWSSVAPAD